MYRHKMFAWVPPCQYASPPKFQVIRISVGGHRKSVVEPTSASLIPVTMETRCFHKKLEFRRYLRKDFCTARYEHKSSEKKIQTLQKPRKKKSWADLAKIGLRKTQPNVCSKRRDSECWTDVDGQNQRLGREIRTGRAR